MEGVSTVMPLAVTAGKLAAAAAGSREAAADAAENRARAVEEQARRQAEGVRRQEREDLSQARADSQRKAAAARVAAADSGLTLSGSSLLSLAALEQAGDETAGRISGKAAWQTRNILEQAADQARSIRLSGRTAQSRAGGLGFLLRLGGDALGGR